MNNTQTNKEELSIGEFIIYGSVIGAFLYQLLGKFVFMLFVAIVILIVILGVICAVTRVNAGEDNTGTGAEYLEADRIITMRDGKKRIIGERRYRL